MYYRDKILIFKHPKGALYFKNIFKKIKIHIYRVRQESLLKNIYIFCSDIVSHYFSNEIEFQIGNYNRILDK